MLVAKKYLWLIFRRDLFLEAYKALFAAFANFVFQNLLIIKIPQTENKKTLLFPLSLIAIKRELK